MFGSVELDEQWAQLLERTELFDQALLRMTFIFGIVVSVQLYERTHRTTGSLVVPGYIGAQLLDPISLLATILNAAATYFLVSIVLPKFAVVYGRSRFVVNIFVSVILSLILVQTLSFVLPQIPSLEAIGYAIPALIAYDMNRQGPRKTAVAVAGAGVLAAIPALLIVGFFPHWVEVASGAPLGLIDIGDVWFPIAALVSTGVSTLLFANHQLRSGGFIGAMYLGLAAINPIQIVFFMAVAVFTYLLVTQVLRRVMIIFGRRKFAVMLMAGSLLAWLVLTVFEAAAPDLLPINSLPVAALFVPALLANDMERSSISEVLLGSVIAAGATLSVVVVASGLVDRQPIPWWAFPILLASLFVLLMPSVRSSQSSTGDDDAEAPPPQEMEDPATESLQIEPQPA